MPRSVRIVGLLGCMSLLFSLGIAPVALAAESGSPPESSARPGEFVLTTEGEQISLAATEASLKAILEELGRRLSVQVVATVSPEEKVTTHFTQLPLADALQRLSQNYAYVMDSAKETGKITKIMVTPAGKGGAQALPAPSTPAPPRAAPFHFEFDPSQYEQNPKEK
jgi:type II secretory pathway component GspD/PulD (secretin)